ncbi:UDP-N-acetylmuramate dehydrogenase [Pararobbsia silviterrae]|uniref:UDP-N-acetylenolpyruvoylglucosamine reductase n=1 Tax=Pararobbsia silviterrae TaxID=1792498 RepID=A0A494XCX2_9BURK|nr:UDP-N-acetylmuramate dehydrogenase [Pararobbsia silviterrae]RKP48647.1 UDP-N-acetylmuramate dehydrogenase [Pararobbsia silviterrae]
MPSFFSDYALREHNTFGFDVRARQACRIEHESDIDEARAFAARDPALAAAPRLVLGGGSNVVLTRDFPGSVWLVALEGRRIVDEDDDAWIVEAAAGENWHAFVAWCLGQGCNGLENLALIPGTVGAAPIQNIGAYGLEMAEYFDSLRAYDFETGQIVEFDDARCAFGYRDSVFKHVARERFLIVSVRFRFPKTWRARAAYADIARALAEAGVTDPSPRDIFDAVVRVRRAKLPDPATLGNAGSFFKNPVIDARQFAELAAAVPDVVSYAQPDGSRKLAAAWLIDRCGWKGRAIADAAVHDRQALVLVNRGRATGADVLALSDAIRDDVFKRFGVMLEAEPVVV